MHAIKYHRAIKVNFNKFFSQKMNIVEVRNAYKFYGKQKGDHRTVLNQLNLTISPGSIYGLMGASGNFLFIHFSKISLLI